LSLPGLSACLPICSLASPSRSYRRYSSSSLSPLFRALCCDLLLRVQPPHQRPSPSRFLALTARQLFSVRSARNHSSSDPRCATVPVQKRLLLPFLPSPPTQLPTTPLACSSQAGSERSTIAWSLTLRQEMDCPSAPPMFRSKRWRPNKASEIFYFMVNSQKKKTNKIGLCDQEPFRGCFLRFDSCLLDHFCWQERASRKP